MIRSRSPSAAAAAAKPGGRATFWVPWSGTITALTAVEHQRVRRRARCSVADAVGGPVERRDADRDAGRAGRRSTGAYQPPSCSVSASSSVVRSNQYPAAVLERLAGRARTSTRRARRGRAEHDARARGSARRRPWSGRRRRGRCRSARARSTSRISVSGVQRRQ